MAKKQNKYYPIPNNKYLDIIKSSPLAHLLVLTGCRASEIIQVIKNYNKDDSYVIVVRKGGSEAPIYLNDEAKKLLEDENGFLMQYQERTKISKHIKRVLVNNGLIGKQYVCHSTRATFATRLHASGVDIITIQTLMNHSKLSTTAAYILFDEMTLSGAVRQLEKGKTLEGKTMPELMKEVLEGRKRLVRLEEEIKELKGRRDMKKCKHEYEGTFICVDICKKCGDVLLPSIEVDMKKILEKEGK